MSKVRKILSSHAVQGDHVGSPVQGERIGQARPLGLVVSDEVHTVIGGMGVGDVGYVVKGAAGEAMFFYCFAKVRKANRADNGRIVYFSFNVCQDFKGRREADIISEVDGL